MSLGIREYEQSRKYTCNTRHGEVGYNSVEKIAKSLDVLKSAKIGTYVSKKKLGVKGYITNAWYINVT